MIPQISVIVPVYNAERYLHRCIGSILFQTFTDLELLLIDDGSLDNSGKICDEYARKDSRIRVFHKENGGASGARNLGLNNARGKWITFIDSDDWVETYFISSLMKDADKNISFVLQSPYYVKGTHHSEIQLEEKLFSGLEGIRQFISEGFLKFSEPHSKLFKTTIIKSNKVYFPIDVKIGEDGIFISQYLKYCDNIKIQSIIGYCYVKSSDSVQSRLYSNDIEYNGFLRWKTSLYDLMDLVNIERDNDKIWFLLTVPLNRTIQSICMDSQMKFKTKLKLLNKISVNDTKWYGKGRHYSFKGNVLKHLVNTRCFIILIYLMLMTK